ncbi:hypothetical protein BVG19_g4672 [[Candida] boidinii]|nr:hypothetical protein BVG19_g4672 [[Candida] boidinii]OWB53256.1 transferase activity protein [[Candida] boidinii]OWB86532.1 transferase activity protein [[Candida] boidinii]
MSSIPKEENVEAQPPKAKHSEEEEAKSLELLENLESLKQHFPTMESINKNILNNIGSKATTATTNASAKKDSTETDNKSNKTLQLSKSINSISKSASSGNVKKGKDDKKSKDIHLQPTTIDKSKLSVEVVTTKDYKKAAKTLKIAFEKDRFVHYLTSKIQNPDLKERVLFALYEASVYNCILEGLVVAVRDIELEQKGDKDCAFLAVACFYQPSGKSKYSSTLSYYWSLARSGYSKLLWMIDTETRKRIFEEQWPLLESLKENVLKDEVDKAWYLSDIGAIPRGRGKGLARLLIDHVTRKYIDTYKFAKVSNKNGDDADADADDESSDSEDDDEDGVDVVSGNPIDSGEDNYSLAMSSGGSGSSRSSSFTSSRRGSIRSGRDHNGISRSGSFVSNSGAGGFDPLQHEINRLSDEVRSLKFDFDNASFNTEYGSEYGSMYTLSGSEYSGGSDSENNNGDDILEQYDQMYYKKHGHRRQKGAICYLESSHPRNRKIYERLGFTFVTKVDIADIPEEDEEGDKEIENVNSSLSSSIDSKSKKIINKLIKTKKLTMDLMVRGIKGSKWKRKD